MRFIIEIDVPEAIKDEIVPEEMETMFLEIAKYYKEKREAGELMKHHAVGIRDGVPSTRVRIQSIKVQGEV